MLNSKQNQSLCEKWEPILEGITDDSTRQMTAVLLENQAKSILTENAREYGSLEEATTVGNLGTFQKFAFPLVRRVFPELIANKICGVQPMQGPVSQIFYLGYNRTGKTAAGNTTSEQVYSRYRMVYGGRVAGTQSNIGSLDTTAGKAGTGDFSYDCAAGSNGLSAGGTTTWASGTVGGQIAAWPTDTIVGAQYFVSAGEKLSGSAIPEVNFTIEQQAVTARTRKFRALWTLEASQDLRAYHNLDLERELTELLSKEVALEIDRELVESVRNIAYAFGDPNYTGANDPIGGQMWGYQNQGNSNALPADGYGQTPGAVDYAQPFGRSPSDAEGTVAGSNPGLSNQSMPTEELGSNIFFVDFGTTALGLAPRHVGEVYANLLAVVNFASQDIYRTTLRGGANWMVVSPFVAAMLSSAAKLEGGLPADGGGQLGASITYKGKWLGQYDVYVDPLYPEDEILMGYKGSSPMDAGFVYAPYIPLQMLPTITDPNTFQPRKGLITRYATAQINPASRFYRIIRIVGANANYMTTPFVKASRTGANYS
tara:strand:- start:2877 stop:4499 length:1623 start_codon:yes stop_codon:yes gene_type:complete